MSYRELDRRDHFAGLAPDNIPNWFHQVFAETAPDEFTWHMEGTRYTVSECGLTQEGEAAIYFAWRAYYADMMLAELEKD